MNKSNTNAIDLRITDAHAHFWDLKQMNYPWLNEVAPINQSFGLTEYNQATADVPISNIIFIQCECLPDEYLQELNYVSQLAAQDSRICGIIPFFPLESDDAHEQIRVLTSNPLVKGIRRLEEEPSSLYKNPRFVANMELLHQHKFSFDLGVKAHQLAAALSLVQAAPDNHYILDHFGKPAIRTKEFSQWRYHMMELAAHPHVYCKLSGLLTEADWKKWAIIDIQPYVDTALEFFGPKRITFGGDWPVVTLAADYNRWFNTAIQLCRALSQDDMHSIFYQNALDFYQIIL
ncbi:amidohydrolase family protein [Olivibacter ginsenosidimutans]|uniref:Amidohydrolase family protein n=1 Tax=Olivibacter ginsenosidimutans TaxID=1176537 RepID=A0ABP9BXA2_9SPHI